MALVIGCWGVESTSKVQKLNYMSQGFPSPSVLSIASNEVYSVELGC